MNAALAEACRPLEERVRRPPRQGARGPATRGRAAPLSGGRYGFLRTSDGREIRFHERSVLPGAFPRLRVDSRVRDAEEGGVKGPPASTVDPIRPMGAAAL